MARMGPGTVRGMSATQLELDGVSGDPENPPSIDNVSDEVLALCRSHYDNPNITRDEVWWYLYGVMHAPDWRAKHKHDLQRKAPRLPLAPDFWAFVRAGRELMSLHADYDKVPEHDGPVLLVDGNPYNGSEPEALRIEKKMRLSGDGTEMRINPRCRLVGIPPAAHMYTISGRSPLQWACDALRVKTDNKIPGYRDDPNSHDDWAGDPYGLIRHLRRLVTVSVRSHAIISALPRSIPS